MSKKIFGLVTALVASAVLMPNAFAAAIAEGREVPSRTSWNELCMANALEKHGADTDYGKHWSSSVDKAFAQSMCTCRHEKVKYLDTMTFDEFTAAAWECREEFAADHMKSAAKYLQIHLDQREKQ